jgi:hypothetical protein
MRAGFIATRGHDTGVGSGAAKGARGGGGAWARGLGAVPSGRPPRTRGGLLLPVFKDLFGRLSV